MTYSELLKDPRWQQKRLKILERDSFTCSSCGDKESTLHVHHCYYERGKLPWVYEEQSLITLCKDCHSIESDSFYTEKNNLTNALSMYGFTSEQFNALTCAVHDFWQTGGREDGPINEVVKILKGGRHSVK